MNTGFGILNYDSEKVFNLKWLPVRPILSHMFDCGAGGVTMEQFLELVHLEKRRAEHKRLMNSKRVSDTELCVVQ